MTDTATDSGSPAEVATAADTAGTQAATRHSRPGFASLSPQRLWEVARAGGKAAQASGLAHRFTTEEARVAGQKGGAKIAADREHMAAIGRRGGLAKGRRSREDLPALAIEPFGEGNDQGSRAAARGAVILGGSALATTASD